MADRSPLEGRLLPRFRLAFLVIIGTITALYVLGGIFNLPFQRADFRIDPTVLGILFGATGVFAGVEVLARLLPKFTKNDE